MCAFCVIAKHGNDRNVEICQAPDTLLCEAVKLSGPVILIPDQWIWGVDVSLSEVGPRTAKHPYFHKGVPG